MKLAVFSDSHGDVQALRFAIEQASMRGTVDIFAFLGDGVQDFFDLQSLMKRSNALAQIYAVRGNNDYVREGLSEELVIAAEGLWVYLTHGHRQRVKLTDHFLYSDARDRQCRIALHGHTHRAFLGESENILRMNPGSVALPAGGGPSFGLLTVEPENIIKPEIVYL